MIFKNYNHWEQKKNLSFDSRKKLRGSFTYYSQLFAMNIPKHRVLLPPKSQTATEPRCCGQIFEENGAKNKWKEVQG